MKKYQNQYFEGERSLFAETNADIDGTTFGMGESPLKESRNIHLTDSIFTYKYPLWYSTHIKVDHSILETMARSGIWYTDDIEINDSTIQAPKILRRSSRIMLNHDHFSDAEETLWNCRDIKMTHVQANGDYFGMNSENIYVDHMNLVGNYVFDGAKNVEVHNSTFVSKDAFWNCENVTIFDSTINGEYLAWNTKNITFVNCTIESDQGLCYIDHLTMRNCRLLRTDLAFEYCSDIDADINSTIMSVKNPISGTIHAHAIDDVILDPTKIDPSQTKIITDNKLNKKETA
ncbi:DUF3737 family protein [Lentilactobacillus parabuchneri]|uniref:DUF3737 family protein n=1 Tax=Lentilactobacillus parabuchneri TaxID=152331 RepID=UPI000A109621|nr:DUF3737 family protein [Lentilactobacillus parabuchneri]ORN04100.1 hypothetical protein FAM21823_00364 [Lentilactobacillus parabuchneri]QOP50845.1 DUF3737 family protein [Lentilactobacillus parabuchneri]